MNVFHHSYSWTHAYCSSSLKPVCMSHTLVLCLSWVGGAVCPSMCMRSRALTVVAIVLWSSGLWYLECATWLPKLQRNTPPPALNIDTVCCSSAFVPTFQTTRYHKLAIPQCQYLYICSIGCRDSIVHVVNGPWARWSMVWIRSFKHFFSSVKCLDQLWGQPSLIFNDNEGSFLVFKVASAWSCLFTSV